MGSQSAFPRDYGTIHSVCIMDLLKCRYLETCSEDLSLLTSKEYPNHKAFMYEIKQNTDSLVYGFEPSTFSMLRALRKHNWMGLLKSEHICVCNFVYYIHLFILWYICSWKGLWNLTIYAWSFVYTMCLFIFHMHHYSFCLLYKELMQWP